MEQFLAGGIRAMNAKYQTESRLYATPNEAWYWSYVESRPERILAEIASGYGNTSTTYTYYFRPEFRGSYLLPPTATYFMYQPEVHAISQYTRLQVH